MSQVLALAVLTLISAVSDKIALKTKSYLSAFFCISAFIIIGNWTIFPYMFGPAQGDTYIVNLTGLSAYTPIITSLYMVHVGTMISITDLVKQWKTVVIGFMAVAIIGVAGIFITSHIIDPYAAVASAPVVAGGSVANILMQEALDTIEAVKGVDLAQVKVVVIMTLCLQTLIAMPICSAIMKAEATSMVKAGRLPALKAEQSGESGWQFKLPFQIPVPEMFKTQSGSLFRACLVGLAGYWFATQIGQNTLLVCMIFGVIFRSLGWLDPHCMTPANSYGWFLFMLTMFCMGSFWQCTPELVLGSVKFLVPIFAIGIIAILINAFVAKFIFRESFRMCFAIGLTSMIGSTGTIYIAQEVSTAVADGDEEARQILEGYCLPRLLIAGFSTLTIGSVIFASMLVPYLTAM